MQFHRPISCATLRACNEHIESHARHPWGLCPTMGTSHSSSHSDTSNGCNFLGHIGIEQHASNQSLLVSIFCINSWLEPKSSYICNMSTSRMWPWSLPGDLTMVNPRVDDREYDSVGCFLFKDTPEDSFACFSSSSIQFDSYALAADLASDARLQCSSVIHARLQLNLSRALTWVPGGWSRCDATYFSGTDRGEIPLWCDKFQKLKGWKVEVHLISSPEWSAWNDFLEISVSELNNNEASEWLVCLMRLSWNFSRY